jgi:putative flippase GtrA
VNISDLVDRLSRSRFLRFGIVGAAGYVVNAAILFSVHNILGVDPYTAGAVSIFLSMNFTWFGNRVLTFPGQAARTPAAILREWVRFIASNAVGAVANYAVYALLIRFGFEPLNNPYVAQIAGVFVGLIFNFTLSKRVVFRE